MENGKRLGMGGDVTIHQLVNMLSDLDAEEGQVMPLVVITDTQRISMFVGIDEVAPVTAEDVAEMREALGETH